MKESVLSQLNENFPNFLLPEAKVNTNLFHVSLKPEGIVPVVKHLKENFGFTFLNDLTAIDWLGKKSPRFEVVYLLKAPKSQHFRMQLRVPVEEGEAVPSITSVFVGANWPEREVFDLFGISFANHPKLERILMPDNFVGYPLRKDYPLEGPGQDYLIEDLLTLHIQEDII